MTSWRKIRAATISFVVLTLLWQLVASVGNFGPILLPTPIEVGKAALELARNGELARNVVASLGRFAVGYSTAVVVGVSLGLALGWSRTLYEYANPILQFFRPIAPTAWTPFIVLSIGIGDLPAIAVIFLAAFFPTATATATAARGIDPIYLKVAANFGVGKRRFLSKIAFPAVFPAIATSLRAALGSAWIFLVAGEMVGAQSGLGYMIVDARNNMRTDRLLAATIAIGTIGLTLDFAIAWTEKRILRAWRGTENVS